VFSLINTLSPVKPVTAALAAAGFTPGLPPGVSARVFLADVDAAAECPCPKCGRVGLTAAKPFKAGLAYRVLRLCLACGHEAEG